MKLYYITCIQGFIAINFMSHFFIIVLVVVIAVIPGYHIILSLVKEIEREQEKALNFLTNT